jgi:hypothetical protein
VNRGFEITLLSLEGLEHFGMFRLEQLNAFKVSLEHTRAEVNEELIDTLHDFELEQSAHFDRMEREWEDQLKDPDDVLLAARNRMEEIRGQIKNLKGSLDRMSPKHKKKSPRGNKEPR